MPTPQFISRHSRFFENLLEHRFLFDLRKSLVLEATPRLVNVLKSEVDAYGFDLVLTVGAQSCHVQMKTRSGKPTSHPYEIAEALWMLPSSCAIWMLYDPATLEPSGYYVLGLPMPPMDWFPASSRRGYRHVKIHQSNHKKLGLTELATLLFPQQSA